MEEKQRKSKTLCSRDLFSGRLTVNGCICYLVLEVKAVHNSQQQEFNVRDCMHLDTFLHLSLNFYVNTQ